MDTADPADDVAYQIADANPDAGVVDFLYVCGDMLVGATATLTDVQPGTYCMYVKFGPGLKGEEVALPVSCSNMAYVYTDPEASIYDPEAAVAEATATLTVLEME